MTPGAPTSLPRRYAAWSLDAAILALLVVALLHRRLCAGLAACGEALDAMSLSMAATMAEAAERGAAPAALAQAWLADPGLHAAVGQLAVALVAVLVPPTLAFALLSLAWFAAFEGSRWQATPGKRLLGLRVVDDDGLPPGYVRAALRQAAGLLSWASLNVGHVLAAHAPRHQALHDRIAGTRVVRVDTRPIPMPARLWLALQLPACFLLLAWLMRIVDRSVAAALDATLGL
ncbi:RDD family protein [Luteimonas sp. FCS-9]|uniref:RDD family protein n=1 Tax=Luteimonas sp. FCS-9 TaxID=1547516 RepID=UPI00069BC074|nr:RDD family protein [Luteimonas sp. FCS-9]